MADDQGSKTSSIDELVKELTKKTPPPVPFSPSGLPKFQGPTPPPVFSKPTSPSIGDGFGPKTPVPQSDIPKPRFSPPQSPSPQTSSPQSSKDYQSSIRTMQDDMASLKQGQKPAGIDVPRKIQQPVPSPAPLAPKPLISEQPHQFKMPSASMGQAQKTGPLPQSKEEKLRSIPPAPPIRQEKTQIYAPPSSPTGEMSGVRNRLFMLIAGAVVLAGVFYWFLVLKMPVNDLEETPTPTPTATPIVDLNSIFSGSLITEVTLGPGSSVDTFNQEISADLAVEGEFRRLHTKRESTTESILPTALTLLDVLNNFGVSYPEGFGTGIAISGLDSAVFSYGQKEIFNKDGSLNLDSPLSRRLILIAEIQDVSSFSQVMRTWEPDLLAEFEDIFGFKRSAGDFLDTTYRGTSIRYNNFPYPDLSIDYSFVGINGKIYFVISNSRESMFSTIDKLLGF